MNKDSGIGSLAEVQFKPIGQANAATMILTDTDGSATSYFISQHALGNLLHCVLNFAASSWQHKPELALETISHMMRTIPAQEAISMQPINGTDCVIKIGLGKIELAVLVPEASNWNRRHNQSGIHQLHRRRAGDIHIGQNGA
ncbi:MAG: hypothetical protein V4634_17090 [Pseudomonadota bacterium]